MAAALVLFSLFGGLFGPIGLLAIPTAAFFLVLGPLALASVALDAWHFPRAGVPRRGYPAAATGLAVVGALLPMLTADSRSGWSLSLVVSALGLLALAERADHAGLPGRAEFLLGATASLFCLLALAGPLGGAVGIAGLLGLQALRQSIVFRLALAVACVPALLTLDVVIDGAWRRRGVEFALFLGVLFVAWTQRKRNVTRVPGLAVA